ncbi:Kv channel-interacting protein [Dirofilaria immitis]|nr:Kv channel-interacting protein 1 [Dirofilaria immitis]
MSNRRRSAGTAEKLKCILNTLTKNDIEIFEHYNQTTIRPNFESILPEQHFTASELRALYRTFKDTLPIYRDSFRNIYANIFPHGDTEQFADLIFDHLVRQHAECVTFTDFIKAYSILFRGTMEEKLNWIYGLYDPKNTGRIEWERILRIITATDDLIGMKALPVIPSAERIEQARQTVQKFDHENKGWVSREDFMKFYGQDEHILQSILALCSAISI